MTFLKYHIDRQCDNRTQLESPKPLTARSNTHTHTHVQWWQNYIVCVEDEEREEKTTHRENDLEALTNQLKLNTEK